MKRLEPEAAVRWIRNFLDKFDSKSLTIGGIIEALDLYIADRFPPPVEKVTLVEDKSPEPCPYLVNGSPMTREDLLSMAAGYPLSETVKTFVTDEETAAIEVLTDLGFNVQFQEAS